MNPATLTLLHTETGGVSFKLLYGLLFVLLVVGMMLANMEALSLGGLVVAVGVVGIYLKLTYDPDPERRYYARSDGRMEIQRLSGGRPTSEFSPIGDWTCSLRKSIVDCSQFDDQDCHEEYSVEVSSRRRRGFQRAVSRDDVRPAAAFCERMASLGMRYDPGGLAPPSPTLRGDARPDGGR